jgi:hypothetical protein
MRVCVAASDLRLAERLLSATTTFPRRHLGTVLAARADLAEALRTLDEALRLHTEAAELWGPFGHAVEHGRALLGNLVLNPADLALAIGSGLLWVSLLVGRHSAWSKVAP